MASLVDFLARTDITDEQRRDAEFLLESIRQEREFYRLPPEPLHHPTLAEMKAGDRLNRIDLVEKICNAHAGKEDLEDWGEVWLPTQIHDRELPDFTFNTVMAGCWAPDDAKQLVLDGWTLTEWPSQMGLRYWRMLFDRIGFSCNDADCPDHPVEDEPTVAYTLYRGSFSSEKRGMSWTTDPERAMWFVNRGDMTGKGRRMRLWRCEVPADRQYAHLCNRGEQEVVADVRGLKITSED